MLSRHNPSMELMFIVFCGPQAAQTKEGLEEIRNQKAIPALIKLAASKAETAHTRQLSLAVLAASCSSSCPQNQVRFVPARALEISPMFSRKIRNDLE